MLSRTSFSIAQCSPGHHSALLNALPDSAQLCSMLSWTALSFETRLAWFDSKLSQTTLINLVPRMSGKRSAWLKAVSGRAQLITGLFRTALSLTLYCTVLYNMLGLIQPCRGQCSAQFSVVRDNAWLDSARSRTVLSLIQRCQGQFSAWFSAVPDSVQPYTALSGTVLGLIQHCPGQCSA